MADNDMRGGGGNKVESFLKIKIKVIPYTEDYSFIDSDYLFFLFLQFKRWYRFNTFSLMEIFLLYTSI